MPTLPTTTVAFASSATEAEFKSFINDFRGYVAYMLGVNGLQTESIVGGVPSGTKMLFAQAAAPTGWAKDTTHNDKSLRVVSGTGGGSGGSVAFSTLFERAAVDGSSLSIAQLAAHTHSVDAHYLGSAATNKISIESSVAYTKLNIATSSAGSGAVHSHGLDLRVQYVDVIICSKD